MLEIQEKTTFSVPLSIEEKEYSIIVNTYKDSEIIKTIILDFKVIGTVITDLKTTIR